MVLLRGVVTHIDLGTKLHLLDLDPDLLLAGGLGLTVLLVPVLAVIHHLADGWIRVGGDLHEVEALITRDTQCVA